MNDVYDVIDTLRQKKHLSMRKLAILAGLPYTTFASFMSRRPATIAKSYLEAIAEVLSVEWTDLVSEAEAERASEEGRTKISTVLTMDEKEYILHNLFNDNPRLQGEAMLRRPRKAYDDAVQRLTANRPRFLQAEGLEAGDEETAIKSIFFISTATIYHINIFFIGALNNNIIDVLAIGIDTL